MVYCGIWDSRKGENSTKGENSARLCLVLFSPFLLAILIPLMPNTTVNHAITYTNVHLVHVDKPGCSLSIEDSKDSPISNECVS